MENYQNQKDSTKRCIHCQYSSEEALTTATGSPNLATIYLKIVKIGINDSIPSDRLDRANVAGVRTNRPATQSHARQDKKPMMSGALLHWEIDDEDDLGRWDLQRRSCFKALARVSPPRIGRRSLERSMARLRRSCEGRLEPGSLLAVAGGGRSVLKGTDDDDDRFGSALAVQGRELGLGQIHNLLGPAKS